MRWAMLTGEYPPQPGGVGDYTRLLACELSRAGDEVHVFAPDHGSALAEDPGVIVHGLPTNFTPASLYKTSALLDTIIEPYCLLVQYVPHAFGYKAMNLFLSMWLLAFRGAPVWVMFHEAVFPFRRQPLKYQVVAAATHFMAAMNLRAAERVFVSIPGWLPHLRKLGRFKNNPVCFPVFSNLPDDIHPGTKEAIRNRFGGGHGKFLIGHFGTYGANISEMLFSILPRVMHSGAGRSLLLLGRNSNIFAEQFINRHPELAPRIHSLDALADRELANSLAACDLVLQPFPDGASGRRGSLMASLALGMPVVTNFGPLSEPIWKESRGAKVLPENANAQDWGGAVDALERDDSARIDLGRNASDFYKAHFSIQRTVAILRSTAQELFI
jgi:glycosyltransferase involved in cell wall biosynthesis